MRLRGLDNFATGNRANIAEILGKLDFRETDLLELNAMRQACEGVDYILHQAAIPSVPKSIADPQPVIASMSMVRSMCLLRLGTPK